jgi:hypothetical protein
MALSQYVAINFLTKFDKKGLERATKELKGFDKVVATGSFRLRAFAKAGGIAAAAGLTIFAKKAVDAALAQERLDKSLKLTLSSIGRGGFATEVSAFIDSLESATNVSEEQLIPALQQLITQTGDLEASQGLLNVALDTSAGTGKDLSTVIDAITKAAIGNYGSISKLGIGISSAEAKTLGFAGSMQLLQKYTGSAEAATLTFDGQVKAFKVSAGEATETLGQGMLTAFAIISGGEPLIKNLGTDLEVAAKQFSNIFVGIAATTKDKGLGVYFDLAKVALQGFVGETGALKDLEKAGIKALSTEKQTANEREDRLKDTKKLLTFEDIIARIQKNILSTQKLTTKEKEKQNALDKKKSDLMAMFDLDAINLQVALSRKLSVEDEARVKILQKLKEGTEAAVNEAQRYADVLKIIEDGKITSGEIDELAKKWGMTNLGVEMYILKLFAANEEIRKMLALLNQAKTPVITTQAATTPTILEPNKYDQVFKNVYEELIAGGSSVAGARSGAGASSRLQAQADAYFKANPDIDPLTGGRRVPMAEGGIVTRPTQALIGEAGAEAVIPLDKMGGFGTTVNINVAGSVISEGELQSVIQDALYNLNRAGAVTQLTNLGR